jgi:hypothetical protein
VFEQVELKSQIFNKVAYDKYTSRMLGWTSNGLIFSVNSVSLQTFQEVVSSEDHEVAVRKVLETYSATPVLVPAHNPRLVGFPQEVQNYLEVQFKYHAPNDLQTKTYEAIRAKAKELAAVVLANTPEGQERELALMYLKQAIMWANQGVALNPLEFDLEKKQELLKALAEKQKAASVEAKAVAAVAPKESAPAPKVAEAAPAPKKRGRKPKA